LTHNLFVWSCLSLVLAACAAAAAPAIPVVSTSAPAVVPAPLTGGVTLRFVSSAASTPVGALLTTHVQVDRAANLMGAEVRVSYDSSVLEVQDQDAQQEGVQIGWGTLLKPDFVARNQVDTANGKINLIVTQAAPTQPITGSGTLATITFKAKSSGASPLTFDIVKLATIEGAAIEHTAQNAQVAVRP